MKRPRFTITITHYHWSCGDGCCSDSGYKLYVEDHRPKVKGYSCVTENSDWDSNRWDKALIEHGVKKIGEKLGRSPIEGEDYRIVEEEKYSEDETFED